MAKKNILISLSLIGLVLLIYACSDSGGKRQETVFKQVPEIAQIRPGSPVKIKLKRSSDGGYSWELSGDDTGKVLEADRKLNESLGNKN